ncbi:MULTISPECIES: PP2C family protein-serine/threonine phosphatase [Kitasatospora]|uniref:Putative serine/threonine protein phosphatase n=1 Tax=Kitasatospora setae (strain ATCC 33774 / DSM 43861 / JCM 3304 / KCC A-0304 / NBRC 14216 / KM-6054) TaxID=452652 RepID=E4N4I1_KITSK|nr:MULTISPECIES: PP2C family protein-serine/threonine phosphatase [Kitasatospora]BAJ26112.1 putative serine/threonine protein phosphatase [Kitasatospora setae KM-6054]
MPTITDASDSPRPLLNRVVRLSPFLLIALSAAADAETPAGQRYDRFVVAAPALAAATWGSFGTLVIGAIAVATEVVLAVIRDGRVGAAGASVIAATVTVTLAASYTSGMRVRRERDLALVRSVARTAQQVVLRPLPDRIGDVGLALYYSAAAEQAQIGGDLYEAVRTPFGVRIILGDVQGKGLPAVELAAALLGSFREAAYDAPDLPALATRLEVGLQRYAERASSPDAAERFATAVLLEIPNGSAVAYLLNCGHPPPVLLGADGSVRPVEPEAPLPPLNLSALVASDYRPQTVPFGPGDRVLLYTDGVSETRDRRGEFYPLTERLARWSAEPDVRLLESLRRDLRRYAGGPADDDVAALLAARLPAPENP